MTVVLSFCVNYVPIILFLQKQKESKKKDSKKFIQSEGKELIHDKLRRASGLIATKIYDIARLPMVHKAPWLRGYKLDTQKIMKSFYRTGITYIFSNFKLRIVLLKQLTSTPL